MALEKGSVVGAALAEQETALELEKISREKALRLCLEAYFRENSHVDKRQGINTNFDLERWLNMAKAGVHGQDNLDDLISTLHVDFNEDRLEMEVTRWLNQNLPLKLN